MKGVETYALTDVGLKRQVNEDSYLCDDGLGLYVVADGMGGHQAGEVASGLVVQTVRDYMERYGPSAKSGEEPPPDADPDLSAPANRLLAAIRLANRAVFELASSKPDLDGMGSTVAAVYLTPQALVAANVGDSPIYLVHGGKASKLSVKHTVMAEAGVDITGVNVPKGEFSHMLTRAMGVEEDVQADVFEVPLFDGDTVVLCSDGLSNKVRTWEIQDTVNGRTAERACRALMDLAMERGGDDNITVVVLRMGGRRGVLARLRSIFTGR
jgi:protein phosphatase